MDGPRLTAGYASASGGGHARSALEAMLKDKFLDSSNRNSRLGEPKDNSLIKTPGSSPNKPRSLSDSVPQLSPSPRFKESTQRSQDDTRLLGTATPSRTSRRPEFASALSLQMPVGSALNNANIKAPASPQVDTRNAYASPAKVLPRHTRGLDFARAATNLHHSTLAEKSSPDSSPTLVQKGVFIPSRKPSMSSMALDQPSVIESMTWSTMRSERGGIPSSLGSVSMMASDDSSDSEDEMDGQEAEDPDEMMLSTPQARKNLDPSAITPFANSLQNGGNGTASSWANILSPVGSSFMNFQRARLRLARSRKSSSSASGNSAMASPVPTSPTMRKDSEGYFGRDIPPLRKHSSRRESISLGTIDLNISSGNDSDTEATKPTPMSPAVVRRAVTRRGNLLPKSRAFGRIRAELMEESMPIDSEIQKEAEVIRQVREAEHEVDRYPKTANSSPALGAITELSESLEGIPEDMDALAPDDMGPSGQGKGLFGAFGRTLSNGISSADFWNNIPGKASTPPPPPSFFRGGSTFSDDTNMDSPATSTPSTSTFPTTAGISDPMQFSLDRSRGSTPSFIPGYISNSNGAVNAPTAADGLRKQNKRRRDDDLDMMSMKRRAVSPGLSSCNSPIISQSPSQSRDLWGRDKPSREGSISMSSSTNNPSAVTSAAQGLSAQSSSSGERSVSGGSATIAGATPVLGPKKVGLMGMNDMQGLAEKMTLE